MSEPSYNKDTDDDRVNNYTSTTFYMRMALLTRRYSQTSAAADDEKIKLFKQKMGEMMLPGRLLQLRQARWSAEYYATVAAENNSEEQIYAIALLMLG